jgi:hypothetical protein
MSHIQRFGAAMLLVLTLPAVILAQSAADQSCEMMPSLGITGISCQNCSLSFATGRRSASFSTEPRILGVAPAGPSAGLLRAGDILIAVDGRLITTRGGGEAFSSYDVGDLVRLSVRRDGRQRDVELRAVEACRTEPPAPLAPPRPLVPGSPPSAARAPSSAPFPPTAPEPLSLRAGSLMSLSEALPPLGIALACTDCSIEVRDDAPAWSFSGPPWIRAVESGSAADAAGLRAGDRVVRVDGLDVTSERGGERLARLEAGRSVILDLERDGLPVVVTLTLPATVPLASAPSPRDPTSRAAPDAPISPAAAGPLRQVSRLGDVDIEVRGEAAVFIEEGDFIIIRSQGLEVRLRRRAGG